MIGLSDKEVRAGNSRCLNEANIRGERGGTDGMSGRQRLRGGQKERGRRAFCPAIIFRHDQRDQLDISNNRFGKCCRSCANTQTKM